MLAALYDLRFLLFPVGAQTNMAVVYSIGHFEPKKKREEDHSHRDILLLTEFYIRTQEEDLLNFVFLLPSCRRRYSCHQLLFFSFGAGGRKRVAALCPSSCLIADTKHKSCRIAWPGGEGTVTHSVRMRRAVIKEERGSKESIPFSPQPLSDCHDAPLRCYIIPDTLAAAPYNVVCTYTVRKKGWRGV